jgi:hypothetical protein
MAHDKQRTESKGTAPAQPGRRLEKPREATSLPVRGEATFVRFNLMSIHYVATRLSSSAWIAIGGKGHGTLQETLSTD